MRCPAPSELATHLSCIDIYSADTTPNAEPAHPSPGRVHVARGKDVLLTTVRDLLAARGSTVGLGSDMDGMASRRAACRIARYPISISPIFRDCMQ